ncbi:hypothetical protein B5P42_31260, partial [Bacillus sp. SRB_331]
MVHTNQIQVQFMPTAEMVADIFTKPTSGATFTKLSKRLVTNKAHGLRGRVEVQTTSPTCRTGPLAVLAQTGRIGPLSRTSDIDEDSTRPLNERPPEEQPCSAASVV